MGTVGGKFLSELSELGLSYSPSLYGKSRAISRYSLKSFEQGNCEQQFTGHCSSLSVWSSYSKFSRASSTSSQEPWRAIPSAVFGFEGQD